MCGAGIVPRTLHLQGKCSTTESQPCPDSNFYLGLVNSIVQFIYFISTYGSMKQNVGDENNPRHSHLVPHKGLKTC